MRREIHMHHRKRPHLSIFASSTSGEVRQPARLGVTVLQYQDGQAQRSKKNSALFSGNDRRVQNIFSRLCALRSGGGRGEGSRASLLATRTTPRPAKRLRLLILLRSPTPDTEGLINYYGPSRARPCLQFATCMEFFDLPLRF
jgi:hypothetical protein